MNWSIEVWISIILSIVPLVWGIAKWVCVKLWGIKKRALSIEYIDSKQYFHKKNDKIELKVIYNNVTTYDAVVTLRIAIKNTGKEDISKAALIDPLKITFGENYEILEVTRVKEYEKIKPNIVYTANTVLLSWALLKHQDQLEIDIIAQNKSLEKERDLSIDFYNSLLCDINIEGVDEIYCEKKTTAKEKTIKKSRGLIILMAVYAVVLTLLTIQTYNSPDYNYMLMLQKDTLVVESKVQVYAKEKIVDIDYFSETVTIEEFNNNYKISGIPESYQKNNDILFIIYLSATILCFIATVLLLIMHQVKKKELLGKKK